MGKIFDALGRHKKERKITTPIQTLKTGDYQALLQSDLEAGWLDLKHPLVTQDPGTVDRLLMFRLIDSDGFLTPAGQAKYIELKSLKPKARVSKPISISKNKVLRSESAPGNKSKKVKKAIIETDTLSIGEEIESKEIKESVNNISIAGKTAQITEEQVDKEPDISAVSRAVIEAEAEPRLDGTPKPLEAVIPNPVETKRQRPVVRAPAPKSSLPSSHNERMDPNLVSLFNPQSFEAEQFKILRSNLLFPISGHPPRSVMVTSPHPGDGKSFVASNLAISVALNINRHVLLMDCDLRRPSIHTRFGFENIPGLSDYLSNGTPLSDLLIRTSIDKLTILPGGQPPENPSELLSSEGMSRLLKETTDRYHDRLIILDSPPPAMSAESSVLARWVDGVLLVVNHGKTSKELLSDVIDRVGREKIIGAIVNNFEVQSTRYYGKYYGKEKVYI